ncbi:MAG: hypothetical protein ACP5OA_00365 [Candidatus Woesearchaeota archaeon]
MKKMLGLFALFMLILPLASVVIADEGPPSPPAVPGLGGSNDVNTTTVNVTGAINATNSTTTCNGVCPQLASVSPDWCIGGEIISSEPDECGCPTPPECLRACTMDAKICPDGTGVGRNSSNNCEFDPCPVAPTNYTVDNGTVVLPVEPPTTIIPCVIPGEVYREMFELEKQLRKSNDDDNISELKSRIESINEQIRIQRTACVGDVEPFNGSSSGRGRGSRVNDTNISRVMPTTSVAVGIFCELPPDLKNELNVALKNYKDAIESKDFNTSKVMREKVAAIEDNARAWREACMVEIVPGLMRRENKTCVIPKDLYEKLENNTYRISELKRLDANIPEDLKSSTAALESKIAYYKAKCNALNVSKEVNGSHIVEYYRERMIEAMADEDMNSRIQSLRELRKEIDETIKNILESKKYMRFEDMEGIADKIRFRAMNVSIGDSSINATDVSVEVEVRGHNITVSPKMFAVVLAQEGYIVKAEDIIIDETGIYVEGILVKDLPAAVYLNNTDLKSNAERVVDMTLGKEGTKAVYTVKYDSARRILGIFPANSRHELKIDASNSNTLEDKAPWWNALSTEVKT